MSESFRIDTNIWGSLFESFMTYLKTEKYPYNETGIEVIKIIEDGDRVEINPNIPGNTFDSRDNTIYDETGSVVRVCEKRDKFYNNIKDQWYFICDNDGLMYRISDKNNNTRIGDMNIYLTMGNVDIESSDPVPPNELPCIKLQMDNEDEMDALGRDSMDEEKAFNFQIMIIAQELDIHTNIGACGYNETSRVKGEVERFIYEYFNSGQCNVIDAETTKQIEQWRRAYQILAERNDDNLRISAINCRITY